MEPDQSTKLRPDELDHRLGYYTGTERYYRHRCGLEVLLTEGAKFLADQAGAYWLMDIIASTIPYFQQDTFVCVDFVREAQGEGATITVTDGNGKTHYRQEIPYTDFPFLNFRLFVAVDGYHERYVVMLPSE